MTTFTKKEAAVLERFIDGLYAEPYFSDVSPDDFVGVEGMDIHGVGGVLASLQSKGVLFVDPDATEDFHIVYLNDNWFHLHETWAKETGVEYKPVEHYVEDSHPTFSEMSPVELASYLEGVAGDHGESGATATMDDYYAAAACIRALNVEVEKLERIRKTLADVLRENMS